MGRTTEINPKKFNQNTVIKLISVFPRTAPLEMKPYKIRNSAVESGGHVHSIRTAVTRWCQSSGFGGEQSGPLKTFTPGQ